MGGAASPSPCATWRSAGAGNIFGTEQSGHIAAVGYGIYCSPVGAGRRSTGRAASQSGHRGRSRSTRQRLIPRPYVPDMRLKIDFYRRFGGFDPDGVRGYPRGVGRPFWPPRQVKYSALAGRTADRRPSPGRSRGFTSKTSTWSCGYRSRGENERICRQKRGACGSWMPGPPICPWTGRGPPETIRSRSNRCCNSLRWMSIIPPGL